MFDIVSLPIFNRLYDLKEEMHMETKWSFDWSQVMLFIEVKGCCLIEAMRCSGLISL